MILGKSGSIVDQRAHNEIFFSLARDGADPHHFEECYRHAIAARRYYEYLRTKHYRLDNPITRQTPIPERFYPTTLPVPDLLERALEAWRDDPVRCTIEPAVE